MREGESLASCPGGRKIFIEKYFILLAKDTDDCSDALTQPMPESIRAGLEGEFKRLQMLSAALSGELDKSAVHKLRANLRWARQKLAAEHDTAKRKVIERDISQIQSNIRTEVERKDRGKKS